MTRSNLFKEYEGFFEKSAEAKPENKAAAKGKFFAFSPFALQDAIGEKSAKKSWIEYQRLRLDGVEAEELIHKIVSKVSGLAALSLGASKEDLGLSDYPYSKMKKDLNHWTAEELKKFYTKLVAAHHLSRMGGDELDLSVEKILLTL